MFSKYTKYNHKGVSLIELMVVIAIIGIMSSIGFALWQSSKNATYLDIAQREVASAVRAAQSYALQGKRLSSGVPSTYGVGFTANNAYCIYHDSFNAGNCIETFALNNGVVLRGFSAGSNVVFFNVPFGDRSSSGNITWTFEHGGTSMTKSIVIYPSGKVEELQ